MPAGQPLTAVVPFAPAPQLIEAELREVLEPSDRGGHPGGWRVRRDVPVAAGLVARFESQRARHELAHDVGERWQLDRLLAVAGNDRRLVHLHDLAEQLADGPQGTVHGSLPSAVCEETVEMVARLAVQLGSLPGSGVAVSAHDGQRVWSSSGLGRDVELVPGSLVVTRQGTLELDDAVVAAWTVEVDGTTVLTEHGTERCDESVGRLLRTIAPGGAGQVTAVAHDEAAGDVLAGLAEGMSDAVRFSRTMLLVEEPTRARPAG